MVRSVGGDDCRPSFDISLFETVFVSTNQRAAMHTRAETPIMTDVFLILKFHDDEFPVLAFCTKAETLGAEPSVLGSAVSIRGESSPVFIGFGPVSVSGRATRIAEVDPADNPPAVLPTSSMTPTHLHEWHWPYFPSTAAGSWMLCLQWEQESSIGEVKRMPCFRCENIPFAAVYRCRCTDAIW